ncbi:hypothetical protein QMZ92_31065 [Streptomyces sp. HNM0645]|uniref:hypothetical protein n=1 Tax=Streptomyces sp. HNM0645 TaxID=2782343 RepID=UPI0024B69BF3|nr:hypothetical protein [Streptomyces sp. HNM0645]MDI9888678.1 hypothetical protein [Streptomyces sp. HNM0645]
MGHVHPGEGFLRRRLPSSAGLTATSQTRVGMWSATPRDLVPVLLVAGAADGRATWAGVVLALLAAAFPVRLPRTGGATALRTAGGAPTG